MVQSGRFEAGVETHTPESRHLRPQQRCLWSGLHVAPYGRASCCQTYRRCGVGSARLHQHDSQDMGLCTRRTADNPGGPDHTNTAPSQTENLSSCGDVDVVEHEAGVNLTVG